MPLLGTDPKEAGASVQTRSCVCASTAALFPRPEGRGALTAVSRGMDNQNVVHPDGRAASDQKKERNRAPRHTVETTQTQAERESRTPRPHTTRLRMYATSRAGQVWRQQTEPGGPGLAAGPGRGQPPRDGSLGAPMALREQTARWPCSTVNALPAPECHRAVRL